MAIKGASRTSRTLALTVKGPAVPSPSPPAPGPVPAGNGTPFGDACQAVGAAHSSP